MRYPLNTLVLSTGQISESQPTIPATVEAKLDDQTIQMILDTGSVLSIINSKELFQSQVIPTTSVPITGIDGSLLPIIGFANLKFKLHGMDFEHKFVVVDGSHIDNRLGLDFLIKQNAQLDFKSKQIRINNVENLIKLQGTTHAITPTKLHNPQVNMDESDEKWRIPVFPAEQIEGDEDQMYSTQPPDDNNNTYPIQTSIFPVVRTDNATKKIQSFQNPELIAGGNPKFCLQFKVFMKYFHIFKFLLLSFIERGQNILAGPKSTMFEPWHFVFDRGKHSFLPAGQTTSDADDCNFLLAHTPLLNLFDTNWTSKFNRKSKQMPGRHFSPKGGSVTLEIRYPDFPSDEIMMSLGFAFAISR